MRRLLVLILALMCLPTYAYTLCGAPAVGKRYLEGDTWPQSGPARGAPGQYVDDDGYWKHCPTWVEPNGGDPKTLEPRPACPGRYGAETWISADGKSECDSRPKDQTDSPNTKLTYGKAGARQYIFDDLGPTRGRQTWQCGLREPGQWALVEQACETIKQAPAPAPRRLSPVMTKPG